jgi:hypothetical protein
MDPDAALNEIREISRDIYADNEVRFKLTAFRLVDLMTGLDEWLSRQGYLPTDWARDA